MVKPQQAKGRREGTCEGQGGPYILGLKFLSCGDGRHHDIGGGEENMVGHGC